MGGFCALRAFCAIAGSFSHDVIHFYEAETKEQENTWQENKDLVNDDEVVEYDEEQEKQP